MITGSANDTEKRNGRAALDLVEHKMRRIGRDESKVSTGADQQLHACVEIAGQVVEPASVEYGEDLVGIKAVDNDVRISCVRLSGTKPRNYGAVVVDGGLGPKPPDHADGSHVSEIDS